MALKTTTIGAFPKPDYLPVMDWFSVGDGMTTSKATETYAASLKDMGGDAEDLFRRAASDVIADQVGAGVDIPTDGEVRRENYIHYHCRHLDGFDFEHLTEKTLREGAYTTRLPTVTGAVAARDAFLPHDWKVAQSCTDLPVKVTMPGPMTIGDTVADSHYNDPKALGAALAIALNAEVLALAEAGCTHIQIDEPLFARKAREALDYGFDHLERCFRGCPEGVVRTVHMCCGYPNELDDDAYPKAPKESYFELADAIEASSIDAISLEDAHRYNDLSLLERFKTTTVIFGAVAIARSRVETVDEIRERLNRALHHIDAARLMAAPDCGLGMLSRDLARAKLKNLCAAAQTVGG